MRMEPIMVTAAPIPAAAGVLDADRLATAQALVDGLLAAADAAGQSAHDALASIVSRAQRGHFTGQLDGHPPDVLADNLTVLFVADRRRLHHPNAQHLHHPPA
jgi:hypothetical protein